MGRPIVKTYRHPASGRTVTLVGMAHLGKDAYYERARQILLDAEAMGAEVHFEGVGRVPDEFEATEHERDLARRFMAALKRIHSNLAAFLGLDLQSKLKMEPHWHRTDLNVIEVLRGYEDPDEFVDRIEMMAAGAEDMPGFMRPMLRIGLKVMPLMGSLGERILKPDQRDKHALEARRNEVAVRAALDAPGDVVAMWGAGHLRGIGAGLGAAGFRRVP